MNIHKLYDKVSVFELREHRFISRVSYVLDDLISGIGNLYRWFKIIWNDRQYDYSYILHVLKKKLEIMHKRFSGDLVFVGQEKEAHNMRVCILLIERILDDNYILSKRFSYLSAVCPDASRKFLREYEEQDLIMLSKLLSKHLRCWWF